MSKTSRGDVLAAGHIYIYDIKKGMRDHSRKDACPGRSNKAPMFMHMATIGESIATNAHMGTRQHAEQAKKGFYTSSVPVNWHRHGCRTRYAVNSIQA